MSKLTNYLLLIANAIVSISAAIVLGIFLHNFKYNNPFTVYQSLVWTVCIPILGFVFGASLIVLYVIQLKKFVKENQTPINPRLLDGYKLSWMVSFFNFLIPLTFSLTAILNKNADTTKILLWVGFGASAFISLLIVGFTAYLNVGVTFSMLSRQELTRLSEEENNQFQNKNNSDNETDKQSQDDTSSNQDQVASAGGFSD